MHRPLRKSGKHSTVIHVSMAKEAVICRGFFVAVGDKVL